ncbi:MAG: spermidine/putrescine ABC transporter substrate-binding protein [Proteobacteria bacterium]|nr:spermidine/putrescine ABC transporter substrate-binding protein [Pseudomonadota bacterium]
MKKQFAVKIILSSFICALILVSLSGCNLIKKFKYDSKVYVYNYDNYVDKDVIKQFEDEYKIEVIYNTYDTNEEMLENIQKGDIQYDVICPSDYVIQKMSQNGMLSEIDKSKIPNMRHIDPKYLEKSEGFDPGNKYAIPHFVGTVGIIYNEDMLKEKNLPKPTKWADLWNPVYKGEILMQDSMRDADMAALKTLGYSMNTKNPDEIKAATDKLIEQIPLVKAYAVDEVRDMMLQKKAAIGMIYSGEYLYIKNALKSKMYDFHLEYIIPEEGSNIWIDSWVIPKNAQNKENAEKWIDFMNRPDIAVKNFRFITYPTPNKGAYALVDKEIQLNKVLFPDDDQIKNCDVYQYLGEETDKIYEENWERFNKSK